MADDWLSGVEHRPIATVNGGTWAEDDPDRAVLHTTEGDSIEGALSTWQNTKVPSHLVFDADEDRTVQCLPFSVSAYALKNLPGGVETNRVGRTIQIEIVGHAGDSPNWPVEKLHRIGKLLRRVKDEGGVDFQFVAPEFVGPESGTIASATAPQRMSQALWRSFNGVCGHQHVPENDHWDPGHINIAEVFIGANIPFVFNNLLLDSQESNMMTTAVLPDGTVRLFVVGLDSAVYMKSINPQGVAGGYVALGGRVRGDIENTEIAP